MTKVIINTPVTSITGLYDAVARAMGKNPDNCRYDCTKIKCAMNFFDEIEAAHRDKSAFGMYWVCYGPKAVEDLKSGEVEIEEGFFQ